MQARGGPEHHGATLSQGLSFCPRCTPPWLLSLQAAPRRERCSWREPALIPYKARGYVVALVLGGGALPGTGGGLSSFPEPDSRAICAAAQRARQRIGCEGAAALAPTVCVSLM